ncbi:Atp-Binding Cassette Sub-Family A Member 13 [Manis pentadactyla]|nr:Atp-Binding Cassette Sub-Family A Member 13 [Manis pentadactyla]
MPIKSDPEISSKVALRRHVEAHPRGPVHNGGSARDWILCDRSPPSFWEVEADAVCDPMPIRAKDLET